MGRNSEQSCSQLPRCTNYRRRVYAAISTKSDKILVPHHNIGKLIAVAMVLPFAKAVNVCQLGEKL